MILTVAQTLGKAWRKFSLVPNSLFPVRLIILSIWSDRGAMYLTIFRLTSGVLIEFNYLSNLMGLLILLRRLAGAIPTIRLTRSSANPGNLKK